MSLTTHPIPVWMNRARSPASAAIVSPISAWYAAFRTTALNGTIAACQSAQKMSRLSAWKMSRFGGCPAILSATPVPPRRSSGPSTRTLNQSLVDQSKKVDKNI